MTIIKKMQNYIQESIEELKKVSWPTKKETQSYTIAVITVSVIIASFLGILDLVFSNILKSIL